jgi:hypothetical protein
VPPAAAATEVAVGCFVGVPDLAQGARVLLAAEQQQQHQEWHYHACATGAAATCLSVVKTVQGCSNSCGSSLDNNCHQLQVFTRQQQKTTASSTVASGTAHKLMTCIACAVQINSNYALQGRKRPDDFRRGANGFLYWFMFNNALLHA